MKYHIFIVFLPLLLSEIMKLSPEEFPIFPLQYPNSIVLFYLPHDKLCERFLREYERASSYIENSDINLIFAQVDMSLPGEKPFEDLKLYPNVRVFLEGKSPKEYLGVYSEKDLISFLESLFYKPPILEIKDENSHIFDNILQKNEVLIVFFGDKYSKDGEQFNEIAVNSKQYTYVFVSSDTLRKEYGIKENISNIIVFRKCGVSKTIERIYYDSLFEGDILKAFLEKNALGCLNLFTETLAQMIFGKESEPFMILFLNLQKSREIFDIYNDFSLVIYKKILVTYSEIAYGLGNRMGKLVGVTQKDLPKALIISTNSHDELIKYQFDKEFTIQNLIEFYDNWASKKIIGYIRSGDYQKETDELVPKINAKDFNKKVVLEKNNVVVIFEKPQCSVCKTIIKILEDYIKKNKGKLLGYRINYMDDELDEIKVGSFPGVLFFSKNNKLNPKYFFEEKTQEKIFEFFDLLILEKFDDNFDEKFKNYQEEL